MKQQHLNNTILVTGSDGFIGKHLVRYLDEKTDHDVITYDWNQEPYKLDFPYNEIDWIIHLGAISSTAFDDVETIFYKNLDYSIDLYNKAIQHNCHFQFASSASVYGKNNNHQQKFNEELTPLNPKTPYAWTKYLFERYVKKNYPSNIHTQIFRYFNVYGPEFEDHKVGQASPFYTFKKQAEENGIITLFEGSDEIKRDFIHVGKLVEWQTEFLMIPESGVWNIGTGITQSFHEIAKTFDCPIKFVPIPEKIKMGYQMYTCADTEKLTSILDKYK